jgi:galactose mutarotase-like enzyme
MVTLENDQLKVQVKAKGAELDSIFSKETALEYLWGGDAKFWNKKSPILFPVVGTLKQNTYLYNNKAYVLTRHGFARDKDFSIADQSNASVTFTLSSNEQTLINYPFPFKLDVIYSLQGNSVQVTYRVKNTGVENMYFSIGGHPAFRVPLEKKLVYEDYYFEFDQLENAYRWLISSEGLLEPNTVPLVINSQVLPLTKELFRNDAVVFKYLNSTKIALKSDKSKHGVEVSFPHFPFIGLWAAPNADFVCIEPWCGIADSTTSKQDFVNKEGINLLVAGEDFERTWTVNVF